MKLDLSNKTALICGSSKGIGKAIADVYAELGANLVLIARNENALMEIVNNYKSKYQGNYYYYAINLNEVENLDYIINSHLNLISGIDILVNNTGGPESGMLLDANLKDFANAFQQHLFASHQLVKLLTPNMIKNNFGRIINIISVSVKQPIENLGISNTIRGAMSSWAKTLSRELAINNITVNNILPGYTNTERLDYLFNSLASKQGKTYEEIVDSTISKIPSGRLAKPQEIAYYAGFLASEYASYITGTSLQIDGGYLSTF